MALFIGTAGDDLYAGGGDADIFDMRQAGNDAVDGGAGDDLFMFGGFFTALDAVTGGDGYDTLLLDGDYSVETVFGAGTLQSVEAITVTAGHSYNLTTNDATVALDGLLAVDATTLIAGETLTFNGDAEGDGSFRIFSGAGDDWITGGARWDFVAAGAGADNVHGGEGQDGLHGNEGDDYLVGGAGNDHLSGGRGNDTLIGGPGADFLLGRVGADTFLYTTVAHSTNLDHDTIDGFNARFDRIDLNVAVTGVDPTLTTGSLSDGATYVSDFEAAITSDVLQAGHAVVWTPDAGTNAGDIYVVIDANGVAGFQSAQDYILELVNPLNLDTLSTDAFI